MPIEQPGNTNGRIRWAAAPSTGDYSILMVVKPVNNTNGYQGVITAGNYYGIWKNTGSTTELALLSSNPVGVQITNDWPQNDEWCVVALVHDDSEAQELTGYFRRFTESSFASASISADVAAPDGLHLNHSPFGEAMAGDLGVVKVWTRVLDESELFNESLKMLVQNPTNIWSHIMAVNITDTDDGLTTGDLYDYSGQNNHGTLSGGAWVAMDGVTGDQHPPMTYGIAGTHVPVAPAAVVTGAVDGAADLADAFGATLRRNGEIVAPVDLTDAIAALMTGQNAIAEPLELLDSQGGRLNRQGAQTEPLELADSVSETVINLGAFGGDVELLETTADRIIARDGVAETVDLSDSTVARLDRQGEIAAPVDFADSQGAQVSDVAEISSDVTLTDSNAVLLTARTDIAEQVDFGDAVLATLTRFSDIGGGVTLEMTVAGSTATILEAIVENIDFAAAFAELVVLRAGIAETADFAAVLETTQTLAASISEEVELTDVQAAFTDGQVTISEPIDLADAWFETLAALSSAVRSRATPRTRRGVATDRDERG